MVTYGELNDSFARAYNRIVGAIGKEAFQTQVLQKFPLVLSTQSVKDIAYSFGFDDSLLIPPANKRTRAQQAVANTQHIGLMLRQGQGVQVGVPVAGQQQHGPVAPQVVHQQPGVPVPAAVPAPVAAAVPVVAHPGTPVQAVIHEVPQTPVPNRRLQRLAPLALTFEAEAAATPAPSPPAVHTPAPVRARSPAPGPMPAASPVPAAASAMEPGASGSLHAVAPAAGAAPPAVNQVHQAESGAGPVQDDPQAMCVICQCQCHIDNREGLALEALPCGHSFHSYCLREWRRVAEIEDLHKCPLDTQATPERGVGSDDFEVVDDPPVPLDASATPPQGPELL